MTKLWFLFTILLAPCVAQNKPAPEPVDGPKAIFHDSLLDNLQGRWKVSGAIMGRPRELELTAEWVLNHQFLFIRQHDTTVVEGKQPYEALLYVGYDNTSERYVVHSIDIFGGRFSETLGYGTRNGNSIRFTFEYPDGPFHNTFTWDPESQSWRFFLEQKDANAKWKTFADQKATLIK